MLMRRVAIPRERSSRGGASEASPTPGPAPPRRGSRPRTSPSHSPRASPERPHPAAPRPAAVEWATAEGPPAVITSAGGKPGDWEQVKGRVVDRLARLCESIAQDTGLAISLAYEKMYPPVVNTAAAVATAADAARNVFGLDNVSTEFSPSMGSEDFAYMLEAQSGCYAWIGAGPAERGRMLHQPRYDFNDALLPLGASYFVSIVEAILGKPSNR